MTKLDALRSEKDPVRQNRLLFEWIESDEERAALYEELRQSHLPLLRFKSVLRSAGPAASWPREDVHLLWRRSEIETALREASVEPYAGLDSGGKFMLGLDRGHEHTKQNAIATGALAFQTSEIEACAAEAFRRASLRPLASHEFDLSELAELAALRFVALLFGLPVEAYPALARYLRGAYTRLTFQIIGRHFVSDSGLPPEGSHAVNALKRELEAHVRAAKHAQNDWDLQQQGIARETVIGRLFREYGDAATEPVFVALGLMAGTVGNVRAAVSITIRDFMTRSDRACSGGRRGERTRSDDSRRLIDEARELAWDKERSRKAQQARAPESTAAPPSPQDPLGRLIIEALLRNPPAAFLAREAKTRMTIRDGDGHEEVIPEGAHLLLALGAEPDEDLLFGGASAQAGFLHRCIGEHLARPLIAEIVRQVLLLPGLSQAIDPESGKPFGLEKRWGASCERYRLQYQRDRRQNQEPLFVVLPIRKPLKENAEKLRQLTSAGAHVVEQALRTSRHVHFAWFTLLENDTHLAMSTVFDGDFDAYVEHFALTVSLFDEQFKYLAVDQPTPIRDHPKAFVETIRKYRRPPLGNYFFSAYPAVGVADIENAGIGAR